MVVRTRIAPSPTGMLHLGTARTALFCWAYARHHGGQFILRIEDTDLERSTEEAVQVILDSMAWLDLDYDEGPIRQTSRLPRYREVIAQMLSAGQAYQCSASRRWRAARSRATTGAGGRRTPPARRHRRA